VIETIFITMPEEPFWWNAYPIEKIAFSSFSSTIRVIYHNSR